MKVQITFKDGKSETLDVETGGSAAFNMPNLYNSDGGFWQAILKDGTQYVVNWDVVKLIRGVAEKVDPAQPPLPGVSA